VVGPEGGAAVAGDPGDGDAPRLRQDVVAPDDLLGGTPADPVPRRPDDLAVLLFTSGTVGAPRPAMLTHGNLLANIEQILASPGKPRGPDEVALGALPLFHIFGLNAVLGVVLHVGASLVLIEQFDATATLEAIGRHGVTVASGVPTMWTALADVPEVAPGSLATVRIALSGAAPLDAHVRRRVTERFGVRLDQGYGLTEASPVVTSGVGLDAPDGSIGRPLPGVDVRLVDGQGQDALVGDPGEIWVHGPNVFAGYWGDPAATAAALGDDGWLRTGDMAVVDDAGFLYLVDRAKDVIIVSGFNVFPAEVEDVIAAHPGVTAAAVLGAPHPQTGETVRAFVVAESGLDEAAIVAWCRQHLARYKCPSSVSFVDELPAGPAGKVLRRSLR
jgi:long-chain acyl-CoA synthetase